MKAELFLSHCEKVRSTGHGTWIACCPAHKDKHPSMTVRELEDGRVLVHCFTGCDVQAILTSVGLDFDALFPDKPQERVAPVRRPFPAADVLEAVASEMLVACIIAHDIYRHNKVMPEEYERLLLARRRIEDARTIANGERPLGRRK